MVMFPLIGGLLSGGASLLGSIFSGNTSAQNTQQQIAANEQMVTQQEQFQQGMSNTAYQRASADMTKAGLNPAMMFGSGGAASTPGGAAISQNVNKQSPFSGLGQAVNSAVNGMVEGKLVDKMSEEIANMGAERAKTEATTQLVKGSVKIQDPEVRQALIRMGYPDALATGLTYGHDISKGIGEAGDAVWSLVPGGKFIRSIVGGGTAKSESSSAPAFSPSQNKRIYDIVEQSKGSSAGQMSGAAGRPSKAMVDEWMKTQSKLGGRDLGTGGSYD